MPTDAKCGLLVGVAVVLAVAVLFFQKDPPPPPLEPIRLSTPVVQTKTQLPPPDSTPTLLPRPSTETPGITVSNPKKGEE
jgi:hypothetical protein